MTAMGRQAGVWDRSSGRRPCTARPLHGGLPAWLYCPSVPAASTDRPTKCTLSKHPTPLARCRYVDNLPPGQAMPYAWDEPTQRNLIRVQVGRAGRRAGLPRGGAGQQGWAVAGRLIC